jgi:hypothetical protein
MTPQSENRNPKPAIQCAAPTRSGGRCRARALPGRCCCHFHDPDRAAQLAASHPKGGAAPRRRYRRQITPAQLTHLLGEFLAQVVQDRAAIDATRLNRLTQLARLWFRTTRCPGTSGLARPDGRGAPGSCVAARLASEIETALADVHASAPAAAPAPSPPASRRLPSHSPGNWRLERQ